MINILEMMEYDQYNPQWKDQMAQVKTRYITVPCQLNYTALYVIDGKKTSIKFIARRKTTSSIE